MRECPWCAADGREGCPEHVDRWPLGVRLAVVCLVALLVDVALAALFAVVVGALS